MLLRMAFTDWRPFHTMMVMIKTRMKARK